MEAEGNQAPPARLAIEGGQDGAPPPEPGQPAVAVAMLAQPAANSRSSHRRRRSSLTKRRDRRRKRSREGASRKRKPQNSSYDRSDYSKPLPVDMTVYCYLDGFYREAVILEAVRREECPVVLPSEQEEEALLPKLGTRTPASAIRKSGASGTAMEISGDDLDEDEDVATPATAAAAAAAADHEAEKKFDEDMDSDDGDGDDDGGDEDGDEDGDDEASATGTGTGTAGGSNRDLASSSEEAGALVTAPAASDSAARDLSLTVEERVRGHAYVYYVHFVWFDRRMDDYVTRQRLRFLDEVPPKLVGITPRPLAAALEPDPIAGIPVKGGGGGGGYGGGHHGGGEDDHHGDAATKVRNIAYITIGPYKMKTWYHTPLPVEYKGTNNLLFCEFCLSFFQHQEELDYHAAVCDMYHPPGIEIYRSHERNVTISMFEVDGTKERQWTENLCYISKLFLEHKTLNEDTSIFLFYVLCEVDEAGCHIVGYFSKEKIWTMNNLACILTLPCHQRKGYGKFLIAFSYALSRIENKTGSPERPLSDLGRRSYMAFWTEVLAQELTQMQERHARELEAQTNALAGSTGLVPMADDDDNGPLAPTPVGRSDLRLSTTIRDLSHITAISITDVQDCLKSSSMIVCKDNQWCLDAERIRELHEQRIAKAKARQAKLEQDPDSVSVDFVRPELIRWTPFRREGRRSRGAGESADAR